MSSVIPTYAVDWLSWLSSDDDRCQGGANVTITPSTAPVAWLPQAPAVGGENSGSGIANFGAATLGQYLRSHEDIAGIAGAGVPKCKGLVRPVFEMKASQQQQVQALMPWAPAGRSALWLFTTKKIEVPGKGFVFLG